MIDMNTLMRGLPVSGLEPQPLARLQGMFTGLEFDEVAKDEWHSNVLWLLEPPADQHLPYLAPVEALYALLRAGGATHAAAHAQAVSAAVCLRRDAASAPWRNFYDRFDENTPECLPVPDFLEWLNHSGYGRALPLPPSALAMLEQASEAARDTVFSHLGSPYQPYTLKTLPPLPLPKWMIEFVPGAPWCHDEYTPDWRNHPFYRWRDAMRPIADRLEQALGEKTYYFADLDDDEDDDDVHRFLVLHWCCTCRPNSSFVRYLLNISGAKHVEELKAALIDPASYTHPFEMNNAFLGMQTFPIPEFEWEKFQKEITGKVGSNDDFPFAARLEMKKAGWAKLHLSLGEQQESVTLSEVFDPFERLIAMNQTLENGGFPSLAINEEGTIVVFEVLKTDDPARALLRLTRKDWFCDRGDEIVLEGLVARAALAAALKKELRRFFTEEFNPQEWDVPSHDPEEYEDGYVYLHERIQGNQWLWGKTGE